MQALSFNDFKSPFFDEIKDPSELSLTFNRFPIIPYQGLNSTSSDNVLNALHRLSEVTPIYSGILQSLQQFTLGAGFEAIQTTNNLFGESRVLTRDEALEYGENLNKILYKTDLNSILSQSLNGLLIDGNIGLKVRISSTGRASIKFVSQKFFRYLKETITEGKKRVLISPTFVYDYLISVHPYSVPVYPDFQELENGAKETFFHFKENRINRELYGLSYAGSSLMNQYLVNQVINYLSAETDNRFTGQILFDVPVPPSGEDEVGIEGKQLLNDLRSVFKSKGQGQSIMVHFRDDETGELKVHEFKSNTNEKFYETIRNIVNEEIITSFAWDKRLIGISRENGLGGNDMEAIFKVASMKVKRHQKMLENAINTVLKAISEALNDESIKRKGIKLKSLYEAAIQSENKVEQAGSKDNDNPLKENLENPEEKIQSKALNGAQVAALVSLAEQVSTGALSIISVKSIAKAAFPFLSNEQIDIIFDNLIIQKDNV